MRPPLMKARLSTLSRATVAQRRARDDLLALFDMSTHQIGLVSELQDNAHSQTALLRFRTIQQPGRPRPLLLFSLGLGYT